MILKTSDRKDSAPTFKYLFVHAQDKKKRGGGGLQREILSGVLAVMCIFHSLEAFIQRVIQNL